MEGGLDEWRTRIDELMIQLDLVNCDIPNEAQERLEATRNVYWLRGPGSLRRPAARMPT